MVLCFTWNYDIMKGMKLWYDRKSKDPAYFIQMGIRNGKKTTTKNIARIGKHSELLKITSDPLSKSFTMIWKSAPFLMLQQPAQRLHLTRTW